jgi:hypothetical protein
MRACRIVADLLGMQRVAKSRARVGSESGVSGLLCLIRQTHHEHDARIAMSAAMHEAEVVVIGAGDGELDSRVAARIDVCGGRLAPAIGPETRFAVRAARATTDDAAAASASGVAVIDEAELERMLDVYEAHTSADRLRAAARRAVDANRAASSIRPTAPVAPVAKMPARQMVTSRHDAKRESSPPPPKPLTEHEQELERHARNVRSLSVSAAFSRKRQPFVQPT